MCCSTRFAKKFFAVAGPAAPDLMAVSGRLFCLTHFWLIAILCCSAHKCKLQLRAMQHQNGGVMKVFLFDTLLADGHLDDIIEFSFSIAVMKALLFDTLFG